MAQAILDGDLWYPDPASDIWMFGHLILELLGAQRPQGHVAVMTSHEWRAQVSQVHTGLLQLPAMRSHVHYLSSLINAQTNYGAQVFCC